MQGIAAVNAGQDSPPRGKKGFASRPRPGEAKPWSCKLFESPIVLLGMALAPFAFAQPACAADADWSATPADGDFNNAANWTPAAVPDGMATFDASTTTSVTFSSDTIVGSLLINSGTYTFSTPANLHLNGAGVIVNGGSAEIDVNPGTTLWFQNGSSAGPATIDNSGTTNFMASASAADATISNDNTITFTNNATAGDAIITTTSGAGVKFFDMSSGGNARFITQSGGTLDISNLASAGTTVGSIEGAGNHLLGGKSLEVGSNDLSTTVSGVISGVGGSLTKVGTGTLTLSGTNTYTGTTTIEDGQLVVTGSIATSTAMDVDAGAELIFWNTSSAGSATITNDGLVQFWVNSTAEDAAITNNSGATIEFLSAATADAATITNGGTVNFRHGSTAGDATIANNGNLNFWNSAAAGDSAIVNNDGATLTFNEDSTAGNGTITNDGSMQFGANARAGTATIINSSGATLTVANNATAEDSTITNDGTLTFVFGGSAGDATITTTNGGNVNFQQSSGGGNARFITQAGGTFDISGLTSSGTTAGSIEGAGNYVLGAKNLEVGSNDRSTTVSGVISGVGGGFTKVGSGTLNLTGINTYTSTTDVNDGTLRVNGSLASSLTTINSGATLGGAGTLGNTTINGGTLAPGNSIGTITVNGDLIFAQGSTYDVEVSPTDADRTDVTGFATLDGTVHATFEGGSYMDRNYTILSAAGGLGGSTFDSLTTSNLPTGFAASLDYAGNDVLLTLEATFTPPAGGLGRNQRHVADAVTGFFNGGGTLPPAFVTLFALTGEELETALSQISGEATTAARQSALQTTNQFFGLMSSPRRGGGTEGGSAFGVSSPRAVPIAFTPGEGAGVRLPDEARWSAWASGYGAASFLDGDAGARDVSARAHGFAAGIDYEAAAEGTLGLAFSGGQGFWSLSNGLGGGASKDYQLGLNGTMRGEDFYIAGAIGYGFHDMSSDRFVFGGSRVTAAFGAHSLGGRLEVGAGFETEEGSGVTPYAASQAQSFITPDYSEDDPQGSGFALSYDGNTSILTRAELGSRFDHALAFEDGTLLKLNARLAYAHQWIGSSSVAATFQALPGASFIVNGASVPRNLALASLGAELALGSGVTLSGRFDGEFAPGAASFAGLGTIGVSW